MVHDYITCKHCHKRIFYSEYTSQWVHYNIEPSPFNLTICSNNWNRKAEPE